MSGHSDFSACEIIKYSENESESESDTESGQSRLDIQRLSESGK